MSESLDRHKADADKLKVGRLITTEQRRDAIHVAIAPVTAGQKLSPGDHIAMRDGVAIHAMRDACIGIVDPFLEATIHKDEQFWLFLYPGSISDMYHHWLHPAFEGPARPVEEAKSKEASEAWLRTFCETADCPSYEKVMAVATSTGGLVEFGPNDDGSGRNEGEYLHFNWYDAHGEIPDEFWDHVEIVIGQKIKHRATYFSCSC